MAATSVPPVVPESIVFGLTHNVQVSTSPLSGIVQTVELPGARWRASLSYSDLTNTEANDLKAWLLSLRGMSGRFLLYDYGKSSPTNSVTGSPVVETGSTARVINTTTTGDVFSVGDYIQIGTDDNRELKMVVAVSGTGLDRNYTIEPALRMTVATALGKSIVYSNPSAVFMLSSNDQSSWNTRGKSFLNDINIDCIEAFA